MNKNDYSQLEKKYFLLKKNHFWSFMGGVSALLVLAGIVSYQGALQALRKTGARNTLKKLEDTDEKAKEMIQMLDKDSNTLEERIKQAGGVIAAGEFTLRLDSWKKDGWELLDLNDDAQPRCLEYSKDFELPDVAHPEQIKIIPVLTGYKLRYPVQERNSEYPYALKCMVGTGGALGPDGVDSSRYRSVFTEITPAENFYEVYISWFAVRTPDVKVLDVDAY